ncbi:magnesium-translocating P-type ATPase [Acetobacter sp. TBRC 12305]|uniref:Magnesium-transporting ATPase, P-type 1 n=1 Tax=Acetobacter garciniae TaxID=2817435 RepID=A0A939KRM9_9PROT|nr:magnesium-translocating P-type ATPase [Acetobacter garciniae]MBO1325496.1 magnesium-translocating P-type ATPase [Acetobacter garciniae]MBX0345332.1 magnesium-translocating P-type ATPase [Acetobacter garciniae]
MSPPPNTPGPTQPHNTGDSHPPDLALFWTLPPEALGQALQSGPEGLSAGEAKRRLEQYGPNTDSKPHTTSTPRAVMRRLFEPLSLILLGAGAVSVATGDASGGSIIVAILVLSIGLDTVQEGYALKAAEALKQSVALRAEVRRDGIFVPVDVSTVVPGDIVRVRGGDIIPADARVLASNSFTVDEAALTGEPYPVEKRPGTVAAQSPADATNAVFRGAVAQTGEATALVVGTGRATLFGSAAAILDEAQAPSPFQRDLHAFGLVIARLTLALVVIVLAMRVIMGRPALESLMFAVALAVGLTPELLPMITTVTLSRGAVRMARRKVIVKRLAAIHDLGAMTVLCTDKTGTLTSAEITLADTLDAAGRPAPRPAMLGAIAARLGGDRGALDQALAEFPATPGDAGWTLQAQRPFDFSRRLGSVLALGPEGPLLIVKGAVEAILPLCTTLRADSTPPLDEPAHALITSRIQTLAEEGKRTIAIASRPWGGAANDIDDHALTGLVFEGLCTFTDPPKPTASAAITRLKERGIALRILSGDDPVIVRRVAGLVGIDVSTILSGPDIAALSDEALAVQVQTVHAYGRLAPDQKSRIVHALQARGAVVGYLGDGINDSPALKVADIGLSVSGATGVAQAAADMILLAPDLEVVADGVEEGRRTFANILKYVRMAASSNLGNMLSMAIASVTLPFLPMLPTQILLNNLLYDFSEIGIPFDTVRPEAVARPQVWDMRALVRFAAVMGPLSSIFDLATFGVLVFVFQARETEFRTAWFLESMATQILVIFIIRTNGRAWHARPGAALVVSSLAALALALVLPFTPLRAWFGFDPPPLPVALTIGLLVGLYLVCAEAIKRFAIIPTRPR